MTNRERYQRKAELFRDINPEERAMRIYEQYRAQPPWGEISLEYRDVVVAQINANIDRLGLYYYANSWPCLWLNSLIDKS